MSANRFRKGVMGGLGMVFPFSRALADATVFGDGAWVCLVLPVALIDLHAEDGAVQMLASGAIYFCF